MSGSGSTQCKNIKSLRESRLQCSNPATHGEYCGVHHKHPRVWEPTSPKSHNRKKLREVNRLKETESAKSIQIFWRKHRGVFLWRQRGPAYWDRAICTNGTDFFSTDAVAEINSAYFISYVGSDRHIYGFDCRSVWTLLQRANESEEASTNPYTRDVFPAAFSKKVHALVRLLTVHKVPVTWEPLVPPTPEQQYRMKVVDIFHTIDSLNYYSSPDWFIGLDRRGQRRLYSELHAIWTHRAALTTAQKNMIVPGYPQKIFRTPPWALTDAPLEVLQKLNMTSIRILITSAEDKNDRILGAMYVVSGLTLVCEAARSAYPWLYESVSGNVLEHEPYDTPTAGVMRLGNLFGVQWLHDILTHRANEIPTLALPPPVNVMEEAPAAPADSHAESDTKEGQ